MSIKDLIDLKWFQNYCTCIADFASSASKFLTFVSAALKAFLLSCLTEIYALVLYGSIKNW
jgi:hypothetical protein